MSGITASFQAAVRQGVEHLETRQATLWVGEDVSSMVLPTGIRLLRKIARVTLQALSHHHFLLPTSEQMVSRLESLGAELSLSVADRSIGRNLPISLEDPFDGTQARIPEWQALLQATHRGIPGYAHRAIVALVEAGFAGRVVTANHDELLESAALRLGYRLNVLNAVGGETPSEQGIRSHLFKLHGTSSRPDQWPLDLHRLHLACDSSLMAELRRTLETCPTLVLGYRGPDPFDLWPMLATTRLNGLMWADETPAASRVERFVPRAGPQLLEGDFAERLLSVQGGWRVRGRLSSFLEGLCQALKVEVPGAAPDEEVTALRDLDELAWFHGDDQPLSPTLLALCEHLQGHWVGAFALLTWLELWSDEALADIFSRRKSLEASLETPHERAWFRYLLAQTGRSQVEEALISHFIGAERPPLEHSSALRLERALSALDLSDLLPSERPLHDEELELERAELSFARSGDVSFLPAPSQVTAELASFTHIERWHRLKAAGAVARQQWSVASQELTRAYAHGGESGSPLMRLRARLALAGLLQRLLEREEIAPLMGVLNALKRKESALAHAQISPATASSLAVGLALRYYDQALGGYAVSLPTLQPHLEPVVRRFIQLAFHREDLDPMPFLFDRDPHRGRTYSYLPNVEDILAALLNNGG